MQEIKYFYGGKVMKFQELKTKEIVRVTDGKKLGFCEDIIIDEETNSVIALRVPKPTRGFKKPEYLEIPFSNISKIGENVILVNDDGVGQMVIEPQEEEKSRFYYAPKIFRRADNKSKK